MLVREQMTSPAVTVEPKRSVGQARAILRRHRIRQLPVVERGRLVGIVSDRDLRACAAAESGVASIMTSGPIVARPDEALDEAAQRLREYKINALPIIEKGKVVGVLSMSDIVDGFVRLCGLLEPTYRLQVAGSGRMNVEKEVRSVADRCHARVHWLHPDPGGRRSTVHVRLEARAIDELTAALEAAGLDVQGVVAAARLAQKGKSGAVKGRRARAG